MARAVHQQCVMTSYLMCTEVQPGNNMADESQNCVKCKDSSVTIKSEHPLCDECFDSHMQMKTCPACKTDSKVKTGDMPPGQMSTRVTDDSLPGYEGRGTIIIHYHFEGGVQTPEQPSPGAGYEGRDFYAYLPDNQDGQKVLAMLKVAWNRRLTFRLATSCMLLYSGITNAQLCYNIGHKRRRDGGAMNNGYPDPDYLQRCQDELASLGITEKDLTAADET